MRNSQRTPIASRLRVAPTLGAMQQAAHRPTFARRAWCLALLVVAWTSGLLAAPAAAEPVAGRGAWSVLSGPLDPPQTASSRAIHDAVRHRMVLVNGADPTRLWELGLGATGSPAWRQVVVRGAEFPAAREGFSAVYDSLRDQVWVYGGTIFASGLTREVWTLSLGDAPEWRRVPTQTGGPVARSGHVAVLDAARDRMLVYGGQCEASTETASYLADTWQLDLAGTHAWTRLAVGSTPPPGRMGATALFDPWNDRMVVFGGWRVGLDPLGYFQNGFVLADAWELTFYGSVTAWSQLRTTTPPPGRHQHVAVLDPVGRRMLVSAGNSWQHRNDLSDTWALSLESGQFNVVHEWTQLAATGSSPYVFGHSAVYSPERGTLVQFGGVGDANECFEFSPTARSWARIDAGVGAAYPSRRTLAVLVPDPASDQLWLFGESGWSCKNDLWSFGLADASSWRALPTTGVSTDCVRRKLIYDPLHRRLLAFGCFRRDGQFRNCSIEVWALPLEEPRVWAPLATGSVVPDGRQEFSLAYDPRRQRILMFGGVTFARAAADLGEDRDDLWSFSLLDDRWTPLPVVNSPGARNRHWAGYDAVGDRMVVVGGATSFYRGFGQRTDCWALPLGADSLRWSALGPDAPMPEFRYETDPWPVDIDPLRNRLLLWNGGSTVWSLSLAAPTAWKPLSPGGEAPTPRESSSMAYDARHDQLVMFGGTDGALRADLLALRFSQPVQARLLSASGTSAPFGRGALVDIALLADEGFSPDSVSIGSLTLAGAHVLDDGLALGRLLPGGPSGGVAPGRRDVNHDGRMDRIVRFPATDMRLSPGDTIAILRGLTPNFEVVARVPLLTGDTRTLAGRLPGLFAGPRVLRLQLRSRLGESLRVRYELASSAPARLEVFDLLGRRVSARDVPVEAAGEQELSLGGPEFRSGVYLVRLRQGAQTTVTRAVIVR